MPKADWRHQNSSIIKGIICILIQLSTKSSFSWKWTRLVSQWVIQTPWAHRSLRHARLILQWPMNKTNTLFPILLPTSHSIVVKKDIRFSHLKRNFFGKHTCCTECSFFAITRHRLNICTSIHITYRNRKDKKKAADSAVESAALHSLSVSFVTKLSWSTPRPSVLHFCTRHSYLFLYSLLWNLNCVIYCTLVGVMKRILNCL